MLLSWLAGEIERRWGTQKYNDAFRARVAAGDPLVRADHDLKHLLKSLGRLAGLLEECDHHGRLVDFVRLGGNRTEAENKWADTVIVLLGLAAHWPGGAIDPVKALARRLAEKFPGEPAPDPLASSLYIERAWFGSVVCAAVERGAISAEAVADILRQITDRNHTDPETVSIKQHVDACVRAETDRCCEIAAQYMSGGDICEEIRAGAGA